MVHNNTRDVEPQLNSPSAWTRWSAPAFVIGGAGVVAIMLLAILEELGISQVEPFFEGSGVILLGSLVELSLVVGLVGLYVRYGNAVGAIGKAGIIVSAIAGGLDVAAKVGLLTLGIEIDLMVFMLLFFVGLPGGMLLFGYATLRNRALSRWSGLPLLIGATAVLTAPAVFDVIHEFPVGILAFLLSGVGWIVLGIVLRGDTPAPLRTSDK